MRTYKIFVDCSICGEEFEVEINKYSKEILTDCWHNKLDLNFFNGWTYSYKGNDIFNERKQIVNYKNNWWKIIGWFKWTREIVYYLHKWFHKKKNYEIWECAKCANREDD